MSDFVNRKKELRILSKNISDDIRVNIIYSLKGRGKSFFIAHIFSRMPNICYINISSEDLFQKKYAEDFFYIKLIGEKLFDHSENKLLNGLNGIDNSLHINFSIQLLFANIGFDTPKNYRILQSTIIKKLKKIKTKVYIHIEDMQKIDMPSLKFLARLIKETDNVFLYLEYVIEQDKSALIEEFIASFGFNINPFCIELESLDWEHVCSIFHNLQLRLNDIDKKTYIQLNGNIKELIFSHKHKQNNIIELNQDEYFLLSLISMANSELNVDDIYEISKKYNDLYYKYALGKLQNIINKMLDKEVILEIKGNLYITDLGLQFNNMKYTAIATEVLSNYYMPIIMADTGSTHSEIIKGLKILATVFSNNDDDRIKKLVPFIKRYILPLNYNKKIINDLYHCATGITQTPEIFICLIQIYFELGCYNEILTLLTDNYIDDSRYNILLAMALVYVKPDDIKTEQTIKGFIENEINKTYVSSLYTCLVALYMKVQSSKSVLKFIKHIYDKNLIIERDKKIINKNISIYYDYYEAVNMIKDSIHYFNENEMKRFSIASYITLATRYAQHGQLKMARKYLEILSNSKYISQKDLAYIDNNLAVIDICLADISEKTYESLFAAYIFLDDEYTKMLAENNLAVYYTLIKDYSSAYDYVDHIEKVGFSRYNFDEYLHLSYMNLLFYYRAVDDNEHVQTYLKKLEQLQLNCYSLELKKYINKTIHNSPLVKNDKWYFMSKYNFRVAFMGHWLIGNFDI